MGIEAAIASLAVLSAAGAATSYVGAQEKNKSLKAASESSKRAAELQKKQLGDQADLESEKAIRQARAIRARALVSAAGSGFDVNSGDVDALLGAIDSDAELNLDIIGDNNRANQALTDSRLEGQLLQYKSQQSSPFLEAFTGLIGGAQTGFSLVAGAQQLSLQADAEAAKAAAANKVP